MIEIKSIYLILIIVFLIIIFGYGLFSIKKSFRDFIKAPYYTQVDVFFGYLAMILLPILLLILYLIGKFENYIII